MSWLGVPAAFTGLVCMNTGRLYRVVEGCANRAMSPQDVEEVIGLSVFAKVEAFKLGITILEKQLFLSDGSVSMFADNDVGNSLSF